ncbi:hypothetical protein ACFO4O_11205 [Glaciecola siphonariae]|uniref:Secreted protein n=1 Tax=Glaciecola siphonariae TaxID=521012 RepID=A0ABV9LZ69_9ALTE
MNRLILACTACLITSATAGVFAQDKASTQNQVQVDTPSKKSVYFFKSQVANNRSIGNALSSLLSRYPEQTVDFVSVAFTAYPEHYEEIIQAAVSTNPNFVDEIIMVANSYQVGNPTEIVEIAINAEPSYADDATRAACKYSPKYFNEIVKTAVSTEPDSADQIAQRLVRAYPNKTMEILVTTIKEVPFVGKYVLDALLATVTDDDEKSNDMIIISVEQLAQHPDAIERLVQLAQEHEISAADVKASALRGGLEEEQIVAIIDRHYQQ